MLLLLHHYILSRSHLEKVSPAWHEKRGLEKPEQNQNGEEDQHLQSIVLKACICVRIDIEKMTTNYNLLMRGLHLCFCICERIRIGKRTSV